MTGRGIDQILPHPAPPEIHEPYIQDARLYVELAERESGPIPRPVPFPYIWGDALGELQRVAPDLRIVNLETAVTARGEPWPGKGIQYRMHPDNVPALTAAGIDCCVLANNHVLDWGYAGLADSLAALAGAGIAVAGAGADLARAQAPAVLRLPDGGRVLVFALGHASSGIPTAWAAAPGRPGVHRLDDLGGRAVEAVGGLIATWRRPGDRVLVSIHWGGNWGWEVPRAQRDFAHALIEAAGADLIHGHSSHHVKGIEVHRGRLILYGCGDLLTDYEGITGQEAYRGDLGLMYFPRLGPDGALLGMTMTPTRVRRLRLTRAGSEDTAWLAGVLTRDGAPFGTAARVREDGRLELVAGASAP
jgi:poly-gamma-glutamate synthesis protein (capsule biosynthesis protein)